MPRCAVPTPSRSSHWDQADSPACQRALLRAPLSSCDVRPSASVATRPATRKSPVLPPKVLPSSSSKALQPDSIPEGCGGGLLGYFSRRNVASRQRHAEKENRDARKRGKICRCHAEQQTSHQSRENKGQHKS